MDTIKVLKFAINIRRIGLNNVKLMALGVGVKRLAYNGYTF